MRVTPWLVAILVTGCSGAQQQRTDGGGQIAKKSGDVTLFLTAELKGTIEPCGCTTDPLGDLARTSRIVSEARKERPVALLDGGSMLYTELQINPQEQLKSELIVKTLQELGLAAAGLGPYDMSDGPQAVRPPRMAANLGKENGVPLEAPRVIEVGGVKIGVFGVADPEVVLGATDPATAARDAIAKLRGAGAQLVVELAAIRRADAKRLARDAPGADLILVGEDLPDNGLTSPDVVGGSFLISPGNRGQVLARVDLHVENGALVDAIGPERAALEGARLDKEIAALAAKLDEWKKDPNAEAGFVKQNQDDLEKMKADRAELAAKPLRAPEHGSWFVLRMIPVKKGLACDAKVVAAKRTLDKAIGEANVKDAAAAPTLDAGKAGYVGVEECAFCHKAQVDFWRGTRHAHAFETLAKIEKQLDRGCIACHVTGWMEPGGSSFAKNEKNEKLHDVQCEICHGPGSLHVEADGKKPMTKTPAENLCATRCHTEEHSDTFQRDAYLRDVLGKGHGEALRAKLGDGPTGHELRAAGLAKAGSNVGESCPR